MPYWSMVKNVKVFVVVIFLFIIITLAPIFYLNTYYIKSISKTEDFLNYSTYTQVKWNDVTNGSIARFYQKNYKNAVNAAATPLDQVREVNKLFYQNYGIGYIELFNFEVQTDKYLFEESKPYKIVGVHKTFIDNSEYVVFVINWLNKDNSKVTLLYLLPKDNFISEGRISEPFINLFSPNSSFFPSPVVKLTNEACNNSFINNGPYCSWYLKNTKKFTEFESEIYTTDVIPARMSRYPTLLFLSKTSI